MAEEQSRQLRKSQVSSERSEEAIRMQNDVARINQNSTCTNQDISHVNDKVSFQRSRLEEQIQAMCQDHVTTQTLTAIEFNIAEFTVNMSLGIRGHEGRLTGLSSR
jgi:hypothetical protein